MSVYAAEQPLTDRVDVDVCVVGAGPAGLTVAREVARRGLRVLVLEAGPVDPPPGGTPITTARSIGVGYDLGASRCGGVGGSSLRWHCTTAYGERYGRLHELDAIDFTPREG